MNWTDCEPAKRCSNPPTCLGVCLASDWQPHQPGNRGERRGGTWTRPCQQRPSEGLGGSSLFSRGRGSGPMGPGAALLPLASVSPKCLGPGSMATAGPNQRGERRPVRAGPSASRKPLSAALGRSVPRWRCELLGAERRSTFGPYASNDRHVGLAPDTTPSSPWPGSLGMDIGKPLPGFHSLWPWMPQAPVSRWGGPVPLPARGTRPNWGARAEMIEILLREKLGAVDTQILPSLKPILTC